MKERTGGTLQTLLLLVVVVLLITNIGLFLRMNQLQRLVINALGGGAPQTFDTLPEGAPAPAFSLKSSSGTAVSLHDFEGPVLLVFSSTTCPACSRMYPVLQQFHEANQEVPLVMISKGSEQEHRTMIEEESLTFPVLEWREDVASAYRVPGTPFFYAVDMNRVVVRAATASSLEQLEALAAALV